jgi:hypothetical protein
MELLCAAAAPAQQRPLLLLNIFVPTRELFGIVESPSAFLSSVLSLILIVATRNFIIRGGLEWLRLQNISVVLLI